MRKWIRLICSCGGTVIAVNHRAKKMLKHKEDYPLIAMTNYLKKNCQKGLQKILQKKSRQESAEK